MDKEGLSIPQIARVTKKSEEYFCRIFAPKTVQNGKETGSVRLGNEKTAPPQSQLRYFGRLHIGVVGCRYQDKANH